MLLNKMLFLFEADADSIKKGTQEGKKGADDLTSAMKKADDQSKKTSMNFASFAKGALGFITAAGIAKGAIGTAMAKSAEIHLLNQTSTAIGENIENVDAFSRALQDNGATGEAAVDSLTKVFLQLGNAASNSAGEQAKMFAEMGISLHDANGKMKGSVEIMGELAGVSDKLGSERAAAYFEKLGITDQRVVETLIKGRKELDESVKSHKALGGVTAETAAKAGKFDTAMNKLTHGLDRGAIKMTDMLLPAITWVIDKLGDLVKWFSENQTVITGFFIAIAAVAAYMYLPAMLAAAAATLAATWPFIAIGAAIGAAAAMFALIYDDIMNFIEGNDSLIGQIINDFPIVGEIINFIVEGIKTAFAAAGMAADALWGGFKAMASGIVGVFKWMWEAVKEYFDFIGGVIDSVSSALSDTTDWVKDKLGFSTEENVTREVEDVYTGGDGSVSPSSRLIDTIQNTQIAQQQIAQAQQQPANAMTSNAINNQRTNNIESNLTIGQVTVETQATDAAGVSAGLSDSLSAELEKMQANNATPITR